MKNIPYVKSYDENGVLTNPITKSNPYVNRFPNRATRKKREPRFKGNGKNCSLTIIGNKAYYRVAQFIPENFKTEFKKDFSGVVLSHDKIESKTVHHYIPKR